MIYYPKQLEKGGIVLISDSFSTVFNEADKAVRKFKPVIQVLIFLLVFTIISSISTVIISVFSIIFFNTSSDFREAVNQCLENGYDFNSLLLLPLLRITSNFATITGIIVVFIYLRKIEKRNLVSAGFVRNKAPLMYLAGFGLGALMITSSALICLASSSGSLKKSPTVDIVFFVLFFLVYIIQGASEEIIFRGFFLVSMRNALRKSKHKTLWAVVISSVLFGLAHGMNPGMTVLAMFNLISAGILYALLFIRFDNIWICCASHSAWNFFQGHILGSQVSGLPGTASVFLFENKGSELINGGSFGFEGGLAVAAVHTAVILLLIFLPSKKNALSSE